MNGGQKDDFIDAMKKYVNVSLMRATALGLVVGSIVTIVIITIALEMDLLCVFLPVLGLWTVVFVRELV